MTSDKQPRQASRYTHINIELHRSCALLLDPTALQSRVAACRDYSAVIYTTASGRFVIVRVHERHAEQGGHNAAQEGFAQLPSNANGGRPPKCWTDCVRENLEALRLLLNGS